MQTMKSWMTKKISALTGEFTFNAMTLTLIHLIQAQANICSNQWFFFQLKFNCSESLKKKQRQTDGKYEYGNESWFIISCKLATAQLLTMQNDLEKMWVIIAAAKNTKVPRGLYQNGWKKD